MNQRIDGHTQLDNMFLRELFQNSQRQVRRILAQDRMTETNAIFVAARCERAERTGIEM
jgi:hypothetical protein